jgi:uncharacterized membrane protein YbhN (UPF0104 family)
LSARAGGAAEQRGVVSRALGFFKRHKRLVQAGVLALIVIFVGAAVWKSWSQLAHYHWQVQWGLLVAAFALLVAQELSYAFIWRGILARMGARLDIVSSQRIYLGAEFVRYIPGNVWHVITRVLWAEQRGVPKAVGFASMVVELATKIASAALVFVLTLFFWPDTHALGAVLVPLLLFGLQPRLLRGTLNLGLRKLGREPVSFALSYADVLLITLYWTLSWLVAGAGFYLLVRALVTTPLPASGLILAIGIYAIGWDIGFVSFVTPSGLGFREVAIAGLLVASGLAPGVALATVVALIARLLSTGSELVCITAVHLVRGAPPLPQPEPMAEARAR